MSEKARNTEEDSLTQLPAEAVIPARLVLDDESFDRVLARIENPPAPTAALRELMRGKDR